ncbi:MAG: HAD family hydrolase [Chloroflexi bacterium]|nr:HAD family hydrolase [Chloroflexota bacterium]
MDRDGTINVDTHFPYQIESLQFIPMALDGLKLLASLPLHIVVVANQAGIALGLFTQEQMSRFNSELRLRAECGGGRIDGFYFCPHLEAKHLPSEVPSCNCSKPSPGMLVEAARDFQLDLSRCFLIGDKTSDIAAGQAAGCMTILVKTGKAGKEDGALAVEPDYLVENLYEAAVIVHSHVERESLAQASPRFRRDL